MLVPMPSPKGTNHERLFIDSRFVRRHRATMAFDSVDPLNDYSLSDVERISDMTARLSDSDKQQMLSILNATSDSKQSKRPQGTDDDVLERILAFLRPRLSKEDLAQFRKLLAGTEQSGEDRKRAQDRRAAMDSAGSDGDFARRFPGAARIAPVVTRAR